MASNVTVRAPRSNLGNSGRNPQAAPGSLITECPTIGHSTRMSENTGGTTQRTISLNSPRHPTRHIHVDVPERPKKPFIYSKTKSPVSKAPKETVSTTSSETVLVSLPTPSGEGRPTGSNQPNEAYETANVSIIETASATQDTGFTHDSVESSEGVRSLLLQPVIQEESRSDSVEASVSAVSKSAPIELTDSHHVDGIVMLAENLVAMRLLNERMNKTLDNIDLRVRDLTLHVIKNGKAVEHLQDRLDTGSSHASRQSSRSSRYVP